MIYLGADHGGYKLKQEIVKFLDKSKVSYQDFGNLKFDKNDDYPEYGYKVAKAVAKDKNAKGILLCGTSYGICIVANKVKGIRAVSVRDLKEAKSSREHNDANILCLSGWNTSSKDAQKIIKTWLKTPFSKAKRHQRRVNKIKKIEKNG